jgi:hypothetical protein
MRLISVLFASFYVFSLSNFRAFSAEATYQPKQPLQKLEMQQVLRPLCASQTHPAQTKKSNPKKKTKSKTKFNFLLRRSAQEGEEVEGSSRKEEAGKHERN